MKRKGLLLIAIIIIASLAFIYSQVQVGRQALRQMSSIWGFFGGRPQKQSANKQSKLHQLFRHGSYDLSINETALNEVCDYAAQANLNFIVFFDFISRITYPWHKTWLTQQRAVG